MLDIEKVTSYADVKVAVSLSGAPVLKASYLDRYILPNHVALVYRHTIHETGGSTWQCVSVKVDGQRVLKPAADGSVRAGKDHHTANWSSYGHKDLAGPVGDRERPVPEWLVNLINELRPSGYVDMPGN